MPDYDCFDPLAEDYLNLTILTRTSELLKLNFAVEIWKLERITTTALPLPNQDDYILHPAPDLSSEEYPFIATGKLSAISSSKQQPLPAVLDGLSYRRGTEDV
jgi:hypothetical protein